MSESRTFGVCCTITGENVGVSNMEDIMKNYTQPHLINNLKIMKM